MSRLLLILVLLLSVSGTFAAQQPIVRAELSTERIAIGESVELKITVLVPTWFSRPLVYPHLELANTITRLPDDSSYPIRERVGSESWSGIVRSYEILPLLAANYSFSGRKIEIEYANPGADPLSVTMDIPPVSFRAGAPAGAESLNPYLAGSDLKLALNVRGDTDELEAGDALVIEYSAELDGLPAIFLPPLAPDITLDGVAVYADTPDVNDTGAARRTEKLTLVFNGGGEFLIPGVTLDYWNTDSQSVESVRSGELVISVSGAPAAAAEQEETERSRVVPVTIACLLLVFAGVLYQWGPRTLRWVRSQREKRRHSEPVLFARVQSALKAHADRESYDAIAYWLGQLGAGYSFRQFARAFGDDSLLMHLNALSGGLYGSNTTIVDHAQLASALENARASYLRNQTRATAQALPSLNP